MTLDPPRRMAAAAQRDLEQALLKVARHAARDACGHDLDTAEDAAVQAVRDFLRHQDSIAADGKAQRTWVRKAAKRNAWRMVEKAGRQDLAGRGGSGLGEAQGGDGDDDGDAAAGRALFEELAMRGRGPKRLSDLAAGEIDMTSVLERLGHDDRRLLIARYVRRIPAKEVAKELGIKPAAVDQRARRAKKRLLALLAEPGGAQ